MLLLRVNEKALVLQWFVLGLKEEAMVLLWFCLGSNETKQRFYSVSA